MDFNVLLGAGRDAISAELLGIWHHVVVKLISG